MVGSTIYVPRTHTHILCVSLAWRKRRHVGWALYMRDQGGRQAGGKKEEGRTRKRAAFDRWNELFFGLSTRYIQQCPKIQEDVLSFVRDFSSLPPLTGTVPESDPSYRRPPGGGGGGGGGARREEGAGGRGGVGGVRERVGWGGGDKKKAFLCTHGNMVVPKRKRKEREKEKEIGRERAIISINSTDDAEISPGVARGFVGVPRPDKKTPVCTV
ncbi:hypothetical protein GGS23DRAFT_523450 [Durotheca rogersii]|uniref:uncharacterized protein n=1 Tax=Durotheca rogersii TaxID=419775 RepID=UPI00221ECCED|nr:uncharacterized protein GGS23DRAFT_523450 [Durotheca rogersii]KAI5863977.1 hypothetical protein GGS23DRAFT_523450 [Durotheca rogersii]